MERGLGLVVDIEAALAGTRLAIAAEELQLFLEQVAFRAEMAEVVALLLGLGQRLLHLRPIEAMEAVALDQCGARATR